MNRDVFEARANALAGVVAVVCGADGVIRWANDAARRELGAAEGALLQDLGGPGARAELSRLLEHASRGPTQHQDVTLRVAGAERKLCVHVTSDGGELLVSGTWLASHPTSSLEAGESALREELQRAYQELADSNRGLLTLHAELDEKNDALRRMVDVKTRVVANVSHEFRTPINSILGITQILLDRLDGDLTSEQEKQLRFVRVSAEALSELVNDLLDLSSLEAGHHQLRTKTFTVEELFASLRGMLRPLFTNDAVKFVLESEEDLPVFDTDMGKIAQILRNLVSNGVKFTERGEVRLRAQSRAARS